MTRGAGHASVGAGMAGKRLKVLVGSYACDPGYGSEPGMGWNFVSNIARFHEVHAIVEEGEFKETLTRFAAEHPEAVEHITFHFVPRTHHNLLRKIWPPSYYWFYRAWHKRAYKLAKELDKKEDFDIVHQVTISGFRCPGYLWKLGKPFVWGPLGGFTDTPWCLLRSLGIGGAIHFAVRNVVNGIQKRLISSTACVVLVRMAAEWRAAARASRPQRFWKPFTMLRTAKWMAPPKPRLPSRHQGVSVNPPSGPHTKGLPSFHR